MARQERGCWPSGGATTRLADLCRAGGAGAVAPGPRRLAELDPGEGGPTEPVPLPLGLLQGGVGTNPWAWLGRVGAGSPVGRVETPRLESQASVPATCKVWPHKLPALWPDMHRPAKGEHAPSVSPGPDVNWPWLPLGGARGQHARSRKPATERAAWAARFNPRSLSPLAWPAA